MNGTFENFALNIVDKKAKGRDVRFDGSLKAFVIEDNPVLTVYLNDLVEAWETEA